MKTLSEEKLKAFLKLHRPHPPDSSEGEWHRILNRIDQDSLKRSRRPHQMIHWWRIVIPVAAAACLALFMVLNFDHEEEMTFSSSDQDAIEDMMQESYAILDNGGSDLNIGSDWLLLIN